MNIPAWLTQLSTAIQKGLSAIDAFVWPALFAEALQPSADFERIRHLLAIRRIDRAMASMQIALTINPGDCEIVMPALAELSHVRNYHVLQLGVDIPPWRDAKADAWKQEAAGLLELLKEAI